MTSSWGGSRPGCGRKPLNENNKKKGYSFQLLTEDIKYIDSLGGKSRSESLKLLIEEHKILKKQIDFSRNS